MKRYRSVLALAAGVSLMSFLLWRDKDRATTDELQSRQRNVWRAFHRERVDRIEVEHASGRYSLRREGAVWSVVTSTGRRPADPMEVERLLSEVEGAEADRTLGQLDARGRERFGLDAPRAQVQLFEGRERTARFSLGGAVQQESAVYAAVSARTGGRDEAATVIVLPRSFGEAFDRAAAEFRDRNIAQLEVARVERLEVVADGRALTLARSGPVWRVAEPSLGRASRGAVEAITSQLRELRATRVIGDDVDDATLQRYGLATPAVRLTVRRGSIEPLALRLGGACPGHDGEVAANREGTRTVVCLPRSFADALRSPPDGLKDDHVLSARTDEIAQVVVHAPGGDFTLRREASGWQALNNAFPVDAESVESWLGTLHDIASGQRLEGDARAANELATPRYTIEVTRSGVEGVETIHVGARSEEGVAVSRDDEPIVLRFSPSVEETLRVEPIRFRPRSVIHDGEEDLRALLIDAAPMREELTRADAQWRLARPVIADGDATMLGELGRSLAELDAERWVTTSPRPEFGLASPRARVVARFEGAHGPGADAGRAAVRTYALSLGANAPSGGVYASLDGTAGVFVVPRALLDAVAQPHVDRASLRVLRDQVARVSIATAGPTARTVTLSQQGERWVTDRGVAADAQRVDQLFDRLAGISAPRVFGYGPPLGVMGFAAPRLTITTQPAGDAGSAPRRIVVGEHFGAGEGAGWYARVDGIDATFSIPDATYEALAEFQP